MLAIVVQVVTDQLHACFLKKTKATIVFFMLSVNQARCCDFEDTEYCAMEVNH